MNLSEKWEMFKEKEKEAARVLFETIKTKGLKSFAKEVGRYIEENFEDRFEKREATIILEFTTEKLENLGLIKLNEKWELQWVSDDFERILNRA